MVSEAKMFKECGQRRRTTEAYLSYKLTKWAFGSGELKMGETCDKYQHNIRMFLNICINCWKVSHFMPI